MKTNSLWIFLVAIMVAFSSCEQNVVNPTAASTSLTELALLAVSSSSGSTSSGTTNSGSTSSTSGFGAKCSLNESTTKSLPTTVTSYITTNYAGSTIEKVGKASQGGYVVYIKKTDTTLAALAFNASGTFVSESTPVTSVDAATLPAAITSYISTNYAGSSAEKAMRASDGKYLVAVKKADGTIVALAFTAEAAFVQEVSMKSKFGCHTSTTTTTTTAAN